MRDLMVIDQSPSRLTGLLLLGFTLIPAISLLTDRSPIALLMVAFFGSHAATMLFSVSFIELNRAARTVVFRRRCLIDLPCATYSLDHFQGVAIITIEDNEGPQSFGLALVAPSVTVQLTSGEKDRDAIEYQAECVANFLNFKIIPDKPKRLQFRLSTLITGAIVSGIVLGFATFVYKLLLPQDPKFATGFILFIIPANIFAMLNFMSWYEDVIRRRELQRSSR